MEGGTDTDKWPLVLSRLILSNNGGRTQNNYYTVGTKSMTVNAPHRLHDF